MLFQSRYRHRHVFVFVIWINTVNRHLGFRGFTTTCKIVPTSATLSKHALATPLEVSSFVASVTFVIVTALRNIMEIIQYLTANCSLRRNICLHVKFTTTIRKGDRNFTCKIRLLKEREDDQLVYNNFLLNGLW